MITVSHGARQGLSHDYDHRVLEDATAALIQDGVASITVCDGASCAKHARPIANQLSKTISRYLARHFDECVQMSPVKLRKKIYGLIRREMNWLKSSLRCEMRDLGSTLLAAAMNAETGQFLAIQLGDGIIIGQNKNGGFVRITCPEQGEDHATYLTSCEDRALREHLQVISGTGLNAMLCSSDGLEGILYSAHSPGVSGDFVQVLQRLSQDPGIVHTLLDKIAASNDKRPLDDFSLAVLAA